MQQPERQRGGYPQRPFKLSVHPSGHGFRFVHFVENAPTYLIEVVAG